MQGIVANWSGRTFAEVVGTEITNGLDGLDRLEDERGRKGLDAKRFDSDGRSRLLYRRSDLEGREPCDKVARLPAWWRSHHHRSLASSSNVLLDRQDTVEGLHFGCATRPTRYSWRWNSWSRVVWPSKVRLRHPTKGIQSRAILTSIYPEGRICTFIGSSIYKCIIKFTEHYFIFCKDTLCATTSWAKIRQNLQTNAYLDLKTLMFLS